MFADEWDGMYTGQTCIEIKDFDIDFSFFASELRHDQENPSLLHPPDYCCLSKGPALPARIMNRCAERLHRMVQ